MLFNHDSGLIQSVLTIDTTVAPSLGGSNSLQIVGTGALILPVGTTEQRPTGVAGMQRFNSATAQLEYFDGTSWVQGADGTVKSITVASDNAALTVANGTVTTTGTVTLSLDQTLVNLAASSPSVSGGTVVRLANDTFVSRELVGTAPVTVTNGDGVNGNPTVSVNAELAGVSTLSTVGGVFRTGSGAYTTKTFGQAGDITVTEDATSITIGYTASGDLAALNALGNGVVVKTGASTYAPRTVAVSGTELSITNANGVAGNPTITYTPSANVAAVNALTSTGYVTRQADGSLVTHSITGTTDTATGSIVVTDGGSVTGTSISFTPGVELAKLAALTATGMLARDGSGAYVSRTITGTGSITVTNGDGVSGNPTISYSAGANLDALAALTGTGYIIQTGSGAYVERSFAVGAGVTAGSLSISNASGVAGATTFDFVPGTEVAGIAALGTSGIVARTATGTYTGRTLTGSVSDAGTLSWTNGDGIGGNPTVAFAPSTEIAALSTIAATGVLVRTGAGAYTGHNIVGSGSIVVTNGTGATAGDITISYTAGANLGSLDSLSGLGFVAQTSTHGFEERTITGTAGNVTVANGNGVNGNPTIDLAGVTQASSGDFVKVTLDSFGRVTGNTAVTTADITTLVDATYVNVTGDTMTGDLSLGGHLITNLGTPVNNTDAVTKLYVDQMSTGLSWKQSVIAATTGNITLSGAQTVDGVTLTDGDRILVRAQTVQAENGIWIYSSAGVWSRAADLDSPQESRAATMFVEQGTTLANSAWTQKDVVTAVGTSPMEFVQFAGAGAYAAGAGLTLTGNSFAITAPVATTLGGTGLTTIGTSGQVLGVGASGNLEYKSVTAGAGVQVTPTAGVLTVANTGVLSNIAGTGISLDATTGNSTITNTGVLSVAAAGTGIVNSVAANGVVTITGNGIESIATSGAGITASAPVAGVVTIANTGITSAQAAGTGVSVATVGGVLTITGSATAVQAGLGIAVNQVGGTATVSNTGVVSITSATASLAQSFDAVTGISTLTNNGITSAVAGTGITVSNSGVGAATIANDGVLTVAVSGTGITNFSASKGVVAIVGTGVDSIGTLGTGVSASIASGALSISNTGVTSNVAGAGISLSGATGAVTVTNTGVLSFTSGTGLSVNTSATGDVSVTNTGVLSLASADARLSVSTSTGAITLTNNAVSGVTAGTGIAVTGDNLAGLVVANTGVVALTGTTNQVAVSNTGTSYTVGLPASVTIDTALTVTALGANKALRTGAAGLVEGVVLNDGQFLVGATGAAPAAASITAGTGVSVTNSANGITISLSGGAAAVTSVTGAVAVGSTTALTVANTGTAQAPVITYGVDAGLESLASMAATAGIVTVGADGNTFTARSLVAGTGVSLSNTDGSADITIANTGVTSVALALPSIFSVTGSPVTTTGTLTASLVSQAAGTVFAAPAVGSGAPTFRALAYSDLPIVLYTENTTAKTVDLTANTVAHASGNFAAANDAAAIEMVLRNSTSNATATELFIDGAAIQAALPANAAWNFTVQVVGRGTGAAAAYRFDGIVARDAAASSTAFIGVPSKSILGETNVALDAAVVADASSGALKVTVTGDASASMKWVATIRATQVIG